MCNTTKLLTPYPEPYSAGKLFTNAHIGVLRGMKTGGLAVPPALAKQFF